MDPKEIAKGEKNDPSPSSPFSPSSSSGLHQQAFPPSSSTPFISTKSLISASSSSAGLMKSPTSSGAESHQKIASRNCNGTVVLTSSPSNEAELQLYRVMQRASLLAYYDTLLEMGGDDVQQLCDAGEEEFLEIMALVGMASKPLHVRRLQKALQEWATSPAMFQTPLTPVQSTQGSPAAVIRPSTSSSPSPMALLAAKETFPQSAPSDGNQGGVELSKDVQPVGCSPCPSPIFGVQGPTSPSPTANPVLVESQITKLAEAAEALVKTLPHFEPKPHNAKKKICRSLETVMKMPEDDPRRMDEIRRYSAIYGRFDCKRNPQKPLTLHEVSVNEAAAQICRFAPALLTRRDDLFSLARQVVRDSGYQFTKAHSGIISLGKNYWSGKSSEEKDCSKRPKLDSIFCCDLSDVDKLKRQDRLEQIAEELKILGVKTDELVKAAQQVRQTNDLSSAQSLQQEMEAVQNKQTQLLLEQSELLKQPLPSRFYRRNGNRNNSSNLESDKTDTEDTDSQFSLSNASSPSQEVGDSRDSLLRDGEIAASNGNGFHAVKSPRKSVSKQGRIFVEISCKIIPLFFVLRSLSIVHFRIENGQNGAMQPKRPMYYWDYPAIPRPRIKPGGTPRNFQWK